jgi:uncharacterized SAM-binding protein YcdF (DUF218 family)
MTRVIATLLVIAVAAGAWLERSAVLSTIGRLVVEENPLARADVLVLVRNKPRVAAEAAAIVKAGYAPRIVLLKAVPRPDDEALRRLGLDPGLEHDVAIRVLRASGVPAQLIELLPEAPDGTNEAARLIARYAQGRGMTRLIAVTERSHTRRTARLLRRELGDKGVVIVRSASRDPFQPETWWQDRSSARELAMEALRWCNSFVLRDWWRSSESADDTAPVGARMRRQDTGIPLMRPRIVAVAARSG